MKAIASAVDDSLAEQGVFRDVRKFVIMPMVKANENARRKEVRRLKTSTFTIFVPKVGNKVVILRYNPRNVDSSPSQCHLLTLDLDTNEVVCGQWLLNKKINVEMSDLSPDGKYFVYNLHDVSLRVPGGTRLEYLTVISKPPYFTGLHVTQCVANPYDDNYFGKRSHGGFFILHQEGYSLKYLAGQDTVVKSGEPLPFKIYKLLPFDLEGRKAELEALKVVELKELLAAANLTKSGIKYQLVERLLDHEEDRHDKIAARKPTYCERHNLKEGSFVIVRNKGIKIQNGFLLINDVKVHDFTLDLFKAISPPEGYDW